MTPFPACGYLPSWSCTFPKITDWREWNSLRTLSPEPWSRAIFFPPHIFLISPSWHICTKSPLWIHVSTRCAPSSWRGHWYVVTEWIGHFSTVRQCCNICTAVLEAFIEIATHSPLPVIPKPKKFWKPSAFFPFIAHLLVNPHLNSREAISNLSSLCLLT